MKTLKEKIEELKENIKSDFDTGQIKDYWDIDYYFDNDSNDENLNNILKECFKEILEKLKKLWMKENSYLIFSDIEEIIKKLSGFKE